MFCKVRWPHWGLLVAAILYVQVDKICCQVFITSQPPVPKLGQTVTLRINYSGKILIVNWYKDNKIILTYNPEKPSELTTGSQYDNRMKVLADGSLQISNVTSSDAGDYTVQATLPDSFAPAPFHLTVDSATENPPLNATPTLAPPTRPPPDLPPTDGQSRGGNNSALIGIVIGSVAAVILVVVLFVLWYKRRCNKSKQTPIYMNDEPPAISSPGEDISPKWKNNNLNRRLPSIPPSITVYQNENCNGFEEDKEHPYTDLNYIYVGSSYFDLQSQKN
ncbi:uncharacterized protein [Dendropsophus ebraccatus]|uniref:uncharacterized protein n=1 Tax=Dendropsophus ebraccatus TaxID=150705 RepID=UPI003831FB62